MSLAIAIVAGIAAALLISTSPSVAYSGQSTRCTVLVVDFEGQESVRTEDLYPAPPSVDSLEWVDYQLARACDRKEERWTWLAGLAALGCVVAGSGARFAGRTDAEGLRPDDRAHESA